MVEIMFLIFMDKTDHAMLRMHFVCIGLDSTMSLKIDLIRFDNIMLVCVFPLGLNHKTMIITSVMMICYTTVEHKRHLYHII